MTVSIPTDIIISEILPKLPIKSLGRFKCVSKSFNTLISSPEFIDIHLRQSLSLNANRLLILTKEDNTDVYLSDIDSPDCDTTAINIPWPLPPGTSLDDDYFVFIVGSCNGLLCVGLACDDYFTCEYKQVVINPCTRAFRQVPCIHTPKHTRDSPLVTFGFGFDDINHDYKLVRVVVNTIRYDAYGDWEPVEREVMVYSLNDNTWNLVEKEDEPTHSLFFRKIDQNCGVVLNNHLLHWICWGSDKCDISIYCFDVRFDKWTDKLPLVDLFTDPMYDYDLLGLKVGTLGVLDGCLCFTADYKQSDVVWMMKDYGVKESWVKLFEISRNPDYYFVGPYGFRQGSKVEVLRWSRLTGVLFWYCIESEADGRIEEITGIPDYDHACFLTGSLVSIPD